MRAIFIKIISSIALLLFSQFSFGQFAVGVKAGRNLSSANIEGLSSYQPNKEFLAATNATVFVSIPLKNGFSFQPELSFQENGFIIKEMRDIKLFNVNVPIGASAHTRIRNLQIPLLAQYTFGRNLVGGYVSFGPFMNYAMSGEVKTKAHAIIDINVATTPINLKNKNFERLGGGLMGAAGVWLKAGHGRILLEAYYQQALTDSFADPIIDIKLKNKSVGFNIGYAYLF